jgi:hypothetical protein
VPFPVGFAVTVRVAVTLRVAVTVLVDAGAVTVTVGAGAVVCDEDTVGRAFVPVDAATVPAGLSMAAELVPVAVHAVRSAMLHRARNPRVSERVIPGIREARGAVAAPA